MLTTEMVFKGHDNESIIELSDEGGVVDLAPVTRVVVSSGSVIIDSDIDSAVFDWSLGNGQIKLLFGGLSLPKRLHDDGRVITYDASNPNGIVWTDDFKFEVR